MKNIAYKIILLFVSVSLMGCSDMSKQNIGTMGGALAGGLIGSQFGGGSGKVLAIGAGAIAGALVGSAIGKNMDETDALKMKSTFENNAVGQPSYWKNSRTGATYTVVPVRNVTYENNPYCRQYRSTAIIDGHKEQVYGTACRAPDGTWQIMKDN